jgi:hypothetical protein
MSPLRYHVMRHDREDHTRGLERGVCSKEAAPAAPQRRVVTVGMARPDAVQAAELPAPG